MYRSLEGYNVVKIINLTPFKWYHLVCTFYFC